jgi:hypothetical protein
MEGSLLNVLELIGATSAVFGLALLLGQVHAAPPPLESDEPETTRPGSRGVFIHN